MEESEDDNVEIIKRVYSLDHSSANNSSLKDYLEETKQRTNYKELYEKEQKEWEDQRAELEQELDRIKNKPEGKLNDQQSISYDAFKYLYESTMGQTVTLSSGSNMNFSLNEQKWMTLIKTLSHFKLPEIVYHQLYYVPDDSEDVRRFITNSIPVQKQFYFNQNKQVQIKWNKYFEALKAAARKTTDLFYIFNTDFSAREFWEIVSAAKLCKNLYFYYDLIPLDFGSDFGEDMNGCKIEYISFNSSGGSSYSNWGQKPCWFEHLIAAIAKWEPLIKSLKTLNIGSCDLTKAKAEEVLNKYELKGIQITGV